MHRASCKLVKQGTPRYTVHVPNLNGSRAIYALYKYRSNDQAIFRMVKRVNGLVELDKWIGELASLGDEQALDNLDDLIDQSHAQ